MDSWDEMNASKVAGGDQVYGVVMKLFEKQGKKDKVPPLSLFPPPSSPLFCLLSFLSISHSSLYKVLELYERCKKEGIKASGAIYEAYINATIGYKPAKYRKKK